MILQRQCLTLLIVPPCFDVLDAILAHDESYFSVSVVVLAILRILFLREKTERNLSYDKDLGSNFCLQFLY